MTLVVFSGDLLLREGDGIRRDGRRDGKGEGDIGKDGKEGEGKEK